MKILNNFLITQPANFKLMDIIDNVIFLNSIVHGSSINEQNVFLS